MKVDEVKPVIIERLKDSPANISELQREAKCSRRVILDAIKELCNENKIKIRELSNQKIIILRSSCPAYIKVMAFATVLSIFILYINLSHPNPVAINLDSNTAIQDERPFLSLLFISFLSGMWFAITILRYDDLVETWDAIKIFFKKIRGL